MRTRRAGAVALVGALVVGAGAGCEAPPSPWRHDLLSVNAVGTNGGNRPSRGPVFSPDGTKVAFSSAASDLGPTDTNNTSDIYIRDLSTGATTLLSMNAAGTGAGNQQSAAPVFSPDGTKVAFTSDASDLVPHDANETTDVFVRDLATDATTLVSVDATGSSGGNDFSSGAAFSPDGTKIAFSSRADDLGPQDTYRDGWEDLDVYVRDLSAGATTLVSVDETGTDSGNRESGEPVFSPDGTSVAFVSSASDLVPDDTNGSQDLFLRDLVSGTTTRVSVDAEGADADGWTSGHPRFSPDGSRLYFRSIATDLVTIPDANVGQDIFVRDLTTGTTTLITTNSPGTATGNAGSDATVLSPDGNRLAFYSEADDLGPVDTNGVGDVYLWDLNTGETTLVSARAGGGDSANAKSVPIAVSPDGTKVLYWSYATDLGPRDSDDPDEDVPPDDPGAGRDLYLTDVTSGATMLVSGNAAGTDSGNQSVIGIAAFSPDGTRIAYDTRSSDLGHTDSSDDGNPLNMVDVYLSTLHGADLAATIAADRADTAPGDTLTYKLEVTNAGPDPADGAVVGVVLPAGTRVVAVDTGAACSSPIADQPHILVCELAPLTPGSHADASITVTVDAAPGDTLTAVALVAASTLDPDTTDNLARSEVAVVSADG